jgi:hypothetical protein
MSWESALQSAIEVAIGIAGFSGIVGAVAGRTAGQWKAADHLRLRILLTASGTALIFAFLPFLLIDSFEPSIVWRSLSGLNAISIAGITIFRYRQSRAIGVSGGSLVIPGVPPFVLNAPVAILMSANAVWLASAPVYVFCVLWGLFIAFVVFARLLLAAARRESE